MLVEDTREKDVQSHLIHYCLSIFIAMHYRNCLTYITLRSTSNLSLFVSMAAPRFFSKGINSVRAKNNLERVYLFILFNEETILALMLLT